MGHLRLRVVIVHNRDFDLSPSPGSSPALTPETDALDPELVSKADVMNAAREVSAALAARGHQSILLPIGGAKNGSPAEAALEALAELRRLAPDLVFNLCESLGGDNRHEAVLPALLDLAGLPYTGSGPLALGLALRKDATKRLLVAHGVPTPEAMALDSDDVSPVLDHPRLPFPLIVKPAREDASVGITRDSVVQGPSALAARVAEVRARYRQPVLVERYIEGRELYVSLLGNGATLAALPMHEIDFSALPADRPRIVTYDGKWVPGCDEYLGTTPVRAALAPEARARCEQAARAAFFALELRDYARCDLRLAEDGTPYVIDVNPNCDLSASAGVARAASYGGLDYPELIERICLAALARTQLVKEPHVHRDRLAAVSPVDASPCGASAHPAPSAKRSRSADGAGLAGRAVHDGGGGGRARARRRRAR